MNESMQHTPPPCPLDHRYDDETPDGYGICVNCGRIENAKYGSGKCPAARVAQLESENIGLPGEKLIGGCVSTPDTRRAACAERGDRTVPERPNKSSRDFAPGSMLTLEPGLMIHGEPPAMRRERLIVSMMPIAVADFDAMERTEKLDLIGIKRNRQNAHTLRWSERRMVATQLAAQYADEIVRQTDEGAAK